MREIRFAYKFQGIC